MAATAGLKVVSRRHVAEQGTELPREGRARTNDGPHVLRPAGDSGAGACKWTVTLARQRFRRGEGHEAVASC
jgi:hypothetical protein